MCVCIKQQSGEIIKEKPSMTHNWCKYNCTCLYLGWCVCMTDHRFMTAGQQAVSSVEHNNKKNLQGG